MTEQDMAALQALYLQWREDRWRRCLDDGPNRLRPGKENKVIAMLYEGIRHQEMVRRGIWKGTAVAVLQRLTQFLNEHPQFERPVCRCGKALWHKGICPVWDTYHAAAITKGHETQRRLRQERESAEFFQMQDGIAAIAKAPRLCACGCGQETEQILHDDRARGMKAGDFNRYIHGHYWVAQTRERQRESRGYESQPMRERKRRAIGEEMVAALLKSPGIDLDTLLSMFSGRGYSKNALSQILWSHTEGFANYRGRADFPRRVQVSRDDAFFETSAAATAIHESHHYRTHHPCQSDW